MVSDFLGESVSEDSDCLLIPPCCSSPFYSFHLKDISVLIIAVPKDKLKGHLYRPMELGFYFTHPT